MTGNGNGIRTARRVVLAAATAALCATALTSCGTERAGGVASGEGIVCPDGSTPNTATTGGGGGSGSGSGSGEDLTSEDVGGTGEDLTSEDVGGTGEDLTSEDVGGAGEDLTSEDVGGAGEDLTSEDVGGAGEDLTSEDIGGAGEDLTSEDVGGTGEDLTSDPGTGDDGLPEGPSECWGPDDGKGDPSQEPKRVNGVPTVGSHRWYGMKTAFTAYVKSTPSKTDDALAERMRMVKIRKPEHSDIMEARIASHCGHPEENICEAQAKAFGEWRRQKYGDKGHVVVFGGAKTTVEATWGL
ncbi:hypothetical protein ACIO3O_31915 [Streptomyces sp. NPDC087440]|uniref:hypothetical protein n=1 Tax=Streptomyces sp. NPDC087440 TaxID=3365790 RepID=UPI0037FB5CED